MNLPNINIDWTINVTNIISILVALFAIIGAYFNLKSEVDHNKVLADQKFIVVDKAIADENTKLDLTASDLKLSLRDSTSDIKQDIRDLRNDLFTNSSTTTTRSRSYNTYSNH